MSARILVVSPVRNEAAHLERVVRGVAAQTVPPARWLVIDDGSTDGTAELLPRLAEDVPFMVTLSSAELTDGEVKDRLAVAAEVRAFDLALSTDDWRAYTHVMKLDGDVELPPDYFEQLLARFDADPSLGVAGGRLVEDHDGHDTVIPIPPHHVHGAVKLYTRACFEAIGGIQQRLGWDTIDITYARMRGFTTCSFDDVVARHHRPFASADGVLRGRARHGECAYVAHYPLWWVAPRALKEATFRPVGLSGAAFLYGYLRAAARRVERVPDAEYRRFSRRELRHRALGALRPAS